MIIPALLLLFVGGPLLTHEVLRLVDLHGQCKQRWFENAMLLQNPICMADARYAHGTKVEDVCKQAQVENTISPEACALRELWRQGALYRLWDAVVGSPWMLFGLLGGTLLLLFQAWQYRAQRQQQEKLIQQALQIMTNNTPTPTPVPKALPAALPAPPIQFIMPAPPPQYQYVSRKRMHRYEEYDYDDCDDEQQQQQCLNRPPTVLDL